MHTIPNGFQHTDSFEDYSIFEKPRSNPKSYWKRAKGALECVMTEKWLVVFVAILYKFYLIRSTFMYIKSLSIEQFDY